MPTPRICLIVVMAENGVIGMDNALPWHLPADLKHFRNLTTGHHILMGRKTWESLGKPLANRINIVLTSQPDRLTDGCVTVSSIEAALDMAREDSKLFVIGGANLYAQMLPKAERLYLTFIHACVEGDTWFPDLTWSDWRELERHTHDADERHHYAFSFITLERKR